MRPRAPRSDYRNDPAPGTRDQDGMPTSDAIESLTSDALSGLHGLADGTVQVCVTSPPFYLLRRYGTSTTWPDGWEGELGHEPHPNDFVRHLLHVFDEVWRVLRDD